MRKMSGLLRRRGVVVEEGREREGAMREWRRVEGILEGERGVNERRSVWEGVIGRG